MFLALLTTAIAILRLVLALTFGRSSRSRSNWWHSLMADLQRNAAREDDEGRRDGCLTRSCCAFASLNMPPQSGTFKEAPLSICAMVPWVR
jgi:hypothetical protein